MLLKLLNENKVFYFEVFLNTSDYEFVGDEEICEIGIFPYRYLELIEEDLEGEEDYHVQKAIIERLIHRLVKDDRVLIDINQKENPSLMVNPNFVLEED